MTDIYQIAPDNKKLLKKIRIIYETAFPPIERRDFNKVIDLIADNRFQLSAIKFENEVVGMLSKWDFESFVYIEHFAISKIFRGIGLGSQVIQNIIQQENRQIVLEVELATDEISLKRIKFYTQFGFGICPEPYIQPPYDKGKETLPMLIMAKPAINSGLEFQKIKATLHQQVYGFFMQDQTDIISF